MARWRSSAPAGGRAGDSTDSGVGGRRASGLGDALSAAGTRRAAVGAAAAPAQHCRCFPGFDRRSSSPRRCPAILVLHALATTSQHSLLRRVSASASSRVPLQCKDHFSHDPARGAHGASSTRFCTDCAIGRDRSSASGDRLVSTAAPGREESARRSGCLVLHKFDDRARRSPVQTQGPPDRHRASLPAPAHHQGARAGGPVVVGFWHANSQLQTMSRTSHVAACDVRPISVCKTSRSSRQGRVDVTRCWAASCCRCQSWRSS